MCVLSYRVASICRHELISYYGYCEDAPHPERCHTDTKNVDASKIDNETPFCKRCYETMEEQIYETFEEEQRKLTNFAASGDIDDAEVRVIRNMLKDELYVKLEYANKPLPALPNNGHATGSADMEKPEKDMAPKGLYMIGGNAPIEVLDQGKRIRVYREKWPAGPI